MIGTMLAGQYCLEKRPVLIGLLLLGLLGLPSSFAFSQSTYCDPACPCEADENFSSVPTDLPATAPDSSPDQRRQAPCPDNCPDCWCSHFWAGDTVHLAQPMVSRPAGVTATAAKSRKPAYGPGADIFRPPQPLLS